MNELYNQHYISIRADGSILDAWSDGPHPEKDTSDAICINRKGGYQFRLYSDGDENPTLFDTNGIPLYKWDGSEIVSRTDDEIEQDRSAIPAPPPSELEQLRADIDFLAIMGGFSL